MHDDIFFYPKFILHFFYLGSNPIISPTQIYNFCNAIDNLKREKVECRYILLSDFEEND